MKAERTKHQPLAEVFGFPIINETAKAKRYREQRLCPFNNKVPNCTKDKANNPLGVCSIFHNGSPVITCPARFREEWLIVENVAKFAFSEDIKWTSLSEIKKMQILHGSCMICFSTILQNSTVLRLLKPYIQALNLPC